MPASGPVGFPPPAGRSPCHRRRCAPRPFRCRAVGRSSGGANAVTSTFRAETVPSFRTRTVNVARLPTSMIPGGVASSSTRAGVPMIATDDSAFASTGSPTVRVPLVASASTATRRVALSASLCALGHELERLLIARAKFADLPLHRTHAPHCRRYPRSWPSPRAAESARTITFDTAASPLFRTVTDQVNSWLT